jgi:aspartate racemase
MMKRIGLLGGMSWESTIEYYRLLNEGVRNRLGGLHSANLAMISFDFDLIERMQAAGEWERAGEVLAEAAGQLRAAGADLVLICTNTMHKCAEAVERAIAIPLLHIVDATAPRITERGIRRIGLLATAFTMEHDFYIDRFRERHGIDVLVPDLEDRRLVHRVIYEELCHGIIDPASRRGYSAVIDRLVDGGAEGIVLGCTEVELLIGQDDSAVPVFPTTRLHVEAAIDAALGETTQVSLDERILDEVED